MSTLSLFLEEIGIEFDAGCVCFKSGEHEGWLTQTMLQKAINCVRVATSRLDRVRMDIVEACRGCEEDVSIWTPIKTPHEGLIFYIIKEKSVGA